MLDKGNVDCMIVGQGLAGSVLAFEFSQRGKKVLLIDKPFLSSASKIAAGIVNPVVFKRLTKSWKADEVLPAAVSFYSAAEDFFGKKLYHEREIVRVISGKMERTLWLKKIKTDVGKYLSEEIEGGYGEVRGGGHLNVLLFLDLIAACFRKKGRLLHERFNFDKLVVTPSGVRYNGIKARNIIFCEGYRAAGNPYFKWLPFKLCKGQLLTIQIEDEHFDKIINKEIFLLPCGRGLYKAGATYEWSTLNEKPSVGGRIYLTKKLNQLLDVPYKIIDHKAGIRPTVSDRMPLIGFHPMHPRVGIFNGMGTKGVMLAPYFAKHLVDHMETALPLDREVDIMRFWPPSS